MSLIINIFDPACLYFKGMKTAYLLFFTVLLCFFTLSLQAWQKKSGINCYKGFGAVPMGKNKKKTLAQCKNICKKKKKCEGIVRLAKNGRKKGMCQLIRKIQIGNCKEDSKYTVYQFRGRHV